MWQAVFLLRQLPFHAVAVLWLSLLAAACLEAQVRVLEESWRWIHFTEKDGLLSKQVYSLLEMEDGTIWAGTFKGLAWYDGYRWHPVREADGLPEIRPFFMHHRSGGGLFVVCRNRLYTGDQGASSASSYLLISKMRLVLQMVPCSCTPEMRSTAITTPS